jgi:hypothetical protein
MKMSELNARLGNVEKAIEKVIEQIQEHNKKRYGTEPEDFYNYNIEGYKLKATLNALKEIEWRLGLELVRLEGEDNEA